MSSPAIRALKVSFNSHITVLTSSEATGITPFIPGIDEVITYDLPWVKIEKPIMPDMVYDIVKELKEKIKLADGVLFASPEYNYSVSGVLKNVIDWCSRPYGQGVWGNKPIAIMGASTGGFGTVR